MKELTFNPQIDIQQCVLWQYANSPALRTLLQDKSAFYQQNVAQFWNDWFNDVFNINTATDFGLSVWGEILDFPRQIKSNTGTIHNLTTEQYRTILKGQLLKFRMDGTVPQVNEWLKVVFGNQGNVFCLDNLDMTAIPFVFETNPSDEILWLLSNVDFLPRPAGVGYEVRIVGNDVFGFNGSGLQPFNQGTFYKDWNQDLDIEQGQYQLSVNAPAGATVTINGLPGNYQSMVEGTSYTWSVTREGYLSVSGSGTLTQDTTINVYQFSIVTTTPNATITINGENCSGIYFLNSLNYQYQVSAIGYTTQTGIGTATSSTNLSISLTQQTFEKSMTEIISDGSGVQIIYSTTAPFSGNYSFSLNAEGGYVSTKGYDYSGKSGISNGGIVLTKIFLNTGDFLEIGKINGGGYLYPQNHGGAGLYLKINNELIAVAGGGGNHIYPGGGYIGGWGSQKYNNTDTDVYYGFSYDGTIPSSKQAANNSYGQNSTGGHTFWSESTITGVFVYEAFGGSGYANPSYDITQIYGGNTKDQGNYGQGSFAIQFTGQN